MQLKVGLKFSSTRHLGLLYSVVSIWKAAYSLTVTYSPFNAAFN